MGKIKLIKSCTTCGFNFNGKCTGRGDIYEKEIKNTIDNCEYWESNLEYFTYLTKEAPWYIKEPFNASKISFSELIEYIDKDYRCKEIDINLYRLIEKTLNISGLELAEMLGVKESVLSYAKNRGTTPKRMKEFSCKLGIPLKFFKKTTNLDITEIEKILNSL